MKRRTLPGGMLLFCIMSISAAAQITPTIHQLLPVKRFLFNHLPEKFIVNDLQLEHLFSGPGTGEVEIPLAGSDYFRGVVTEKVQRNKNVVSINIRSSNYDGALLTISQLSYNNSAPAYIGRIVNIKYGDVLLLNKEAGQHFFIKQKQSLVIAE